MLGYVVTETRGTGDVLLREVAMRLRAAGVAVAGAVQAETATARDMDVLMLPDGDTVRISQDLGPMAEGCKLDHGRLTDVVGRVSAALSAEPALVIVNKWAGQESEGHGFRPVIGDAVAAGIPVLTVVHRNHLDAFLAFAGEFAESLPMNVEAVLGWCPRAEAPAA